MSLRFPVAGLATSLLLAPVTGLADTAAEIRELRDLVQKLSQRLEQLERQPPAAPAAPPAAAPDVSALDQQVRVLERQQELAAEAAAERARTAPVVSLGPSGFSVRTPDTNFVLRARGYVQADGRLFLNDSGANDTLLMRRVRPIVEGTVYRDFDYRVMLDFGSGASLSAANNALVQDAYVNWRIDPALQLRVGKDKEPVGLERLQSGANLLFVERAFPTQLAPNRDVGVQLRGELWQGRLEYQLGLFNGVADGGSGDFDTADSDKDFAGRVFAQPFRNSDNDWLRGFGFGVAGTYGEQDGALRNYFTTGQLRAFSYLTGTGATNSPNVLADGTHWRFTPQGWYYKGPFGLLGEFIISDQEIARTAGNRTLRANPQNTAWQVAASYFLTGEDNSFRPVQPLKPLDFGGEGWGAVELTARVSELDIDDDLFPLFANPRQSVTGITEFGFGANWHLNRFIKFSVNYHHLDFDGGEDNPATRDSEDVILGRVQFSF